MIASFFFNTSKDGVPVYLDLEDATLDELSAGLKDVARPSRTSFIEDVGATLLTSSNSGRLLDLHLERLRTWRKSPHSEPPPFVAVLALFSLIAEGMVGNEKFSPNNYYGRLCELLRVTDEPAVVSVKRDFAEQTHELWDGLNAWLLENEGRFGLPTAFAFDHRVHVGIPISQALVREHDRRCFTRLFASADLQPGLRLSVPDMTAVLREWLPKCPASPNLMRLWRQKSVQEQVAELACRELATWQGGEESSEAGQHEARVSLVALLRRSPLPSLEFDLVVPRTGKTAAGVYRLSTDASQQSRLALQRCDWRLTAQESGLFVNSYSFAESRRLSLPDILLGNLILERNETRLVRQMRTVIPLKFDEAQRAYFEVTRLELGQEFIVLARTEVAQKVQDALKAACAGTLSSVKAGIPTGWSCFGPAVLARKVEPTSPDLNPLVPVGSRIQMVLGGGFALPQRSTWHTRLPPELRIVIEAKDVEYGLTIVQTQSLSGDCSVREVPIGNVSSSTVLPLDHIGLADGDYRILAKSAKLTHLSVSFSLRSAEFARSVVTSQPPLLHIPAPASSLWALTAVPEAEPGQGGIRGADMPWLPERDLTDIGALAPKPCSTWTGADEPPADPTPGVRDPDAMSKVGLCPPHVFLCPPAGYRRPTPPRTGKCKNCGLRETFYRLRRHG